MMTSWNGNIFSVTDPLWGEFTGHRWIPSTKASNAISDIIVLDSINWVGTVDAVLSTWHQQPQFYFDERISIMLNLIWFSIVVVTTSAHWVLMWCIQILKTVGEGNCLRHHNSRYVLICFQIPFITLYPIWTGSSVYVGAAQCGFKAPNYSLKRNTNIFKCVDCSVRFTTLSNVPVVILLATCWVNQPLFVAWRGISMQQQGN